MKSLSMVFEMKVAEQYSTSVRFTVLNGGFTWRRRSEEV